MIDALILDWAGTLADDVAITLEATNRTLERFGGAPVDLDTYRSEFTIPVMGFYESRIPDVPLDDVDDAFFTSYREIAPEVPLFDGVADLLRIGRSRGLRIFILTTVMDEIVDAALVAHGLRDCVEAIHGGAVDKREVLPALLREHGLVRDRCLYVGDSPHDVEAAQVARVRAGAALYGYSPPARLEPTGADYAFEDVAALQRCLDHEHLLDTTRLVIATVGGVVLDDDGRILVVRTRKWSNTFGIPGGKIQYGETMEAAYEREMLEEVGLRLRDTRFVMIQDCIESTEFEKPRHFLLINYVSCAVDPSTLATNYELEEARWVTLEEARALELNTPTRIVLDEAERLGFLGVKS